MEFPLRATHLAKRYGSTEALIDFTVEVPEGAIFALVGPNGAGKTTAIQTLAGLHLPTQGRAELLGVDSRKLGPREWQRIGYVSENQQLPEWMKVGQFLDYLRPFYPEWSAEEAAALVQGFHLPGDRKLSALSRGMKVKAALASSLAYRPRLLILDEPFTGLDALVRDELIESLLERAGNMTVFIASHDLAEIESFASHVAYLEAGRIRFVDEMSKLSERFREIEITLESALPQVPKDYPATWLNLETGGVVVRFTDSTYRAGPTENEIRRLFPAVRDIAVRPLPLRSVVVALAKAGRKEQRQ